MDDDDEESSSVWHIHVSGLPKVVFPVRTPISDDRIREPSVEVLPIDAAVVTPQKRVCEGASQVASSQSSLCECCHAA